MNIIPDPRSRPQRQRRPPPHTLLQLLRHPPLIAREELAGEAALAAQGARADLGAGLVAEVGGVDAELEVVPGVQHFVGEGVLEVAPVAELVGAEEDAVREGEAAGLGGCAAAAEDVGAVEGWSCVGAI